MNQKTRRGIKEGIGLGLIAGVIFAVMEVVAAVMMGNPALMPFRMFASTVLGSAALETAGAGTAFLVGAIAHLILSGIFGLIYGAVNAQFGADTRASWGQQAGIGVAFGALLWLVNFQIIARVLYPWFLEAPQFAQMMLHALFFGLPLGVMYAAAERRVVLPRRTAPAGA